MSSSSYILIVDMIVTLDTSKLCLIDSLSISEVVDNDDDDMKKMMMGRSIMTWALMISRRGVLYSGYVLLLNHWVY